MSALPPIELSDPPDPDAWPALLGLLARHNEPFIGPHDPRPLALVVRDAESRIAGGLWGRTLYSWLSVFLLIVPADRRGVGLGTALLRRAEAEAASRGCVGVMLDTFSFQARPFYEKQGYRPFGELDGFPPGHRMILLHKRLDAAPPG